MKREELNHRCNKRAPLLWIFMAGCLTLTGCASFGSYSLNQAVIKYDESVLQAEQQILLLNIIRMHDNQPIHFTAASSIAATFGLTFTGGYNSAGQGSTSQTYVGNFALGTTVSENPTITLTPMQGKDYAARLLKPINASYINTLLMQRNQPRLDKMLRLLTKNFYMIRQKRAKELFERMINDSKGKPLPDYTGNKYEYPIYKHNDQLEKMINNNPTDKKTSALLDSIRDEYKYRIYTDKDMDNNKGEFNEKESSCLLNSLDDCYMVNIPAKIRDNGERNDISHYELFRKVVLHIQSLMFYNIPFFFSLDFYVPIEGTFKPSDDSHRNSKQSQKPDPDKIADIVGALEKNYTWQNIKTTEQAETQDNGLILTKRYPITAITDFDIDEMGYKYKKKLLKQIQEDLGLNAEIALDEGIIIVLLRGDKYYNRWPIYGYFTVRNFREALQFLAESLGSNDEHEYASEYYVNPSKFTEFFLFRENLTQAAGKEPYKCLSNPAKTLKINMASEIRPSQSDDIVYTNYNGKAYWISSLQNQACKPPTGDVSSYANPCPPRWDGEVFSIVYEIFQFNGNEAPVSIPAITISK